MKLRRAQAAHIARHYIYYIYSLPAAVLRDVIPLLGFCAHEQNIAI